MFYVILKVLFHFSKNQQHINRKYIQTKEINGTAILEKNQVRQHLIILSKKIPTS